MKIVWRNQWGARYGDGVDNRPLPATEAWLHHSVTFDPNLSFEDLNNNSLDDDEQRAMLLIEDIGRERFGAAYGFPYSAAFMPRGGIAYQGHHPAKMGAHTYQHNDEGVGFVLVGNYSNRKPTEEQLDTVAWALVEWKRRGWLLNARLNGGHRDLKPTECPGNLAYPLISEINDRAVALETGDMANFTDKHAKIIEMLGRIYEPEDWSTPEKEIGWVRGQINKTNAEVAAVLNKVNAVLSKLDAMVGNGETPGTIWGTDGQVRNIYDNPNNSSWKAGKTLEHIVLQLEDIKNQLSS